MTGPSTSTSTPALVEDRSLAAAAPDAVIIWRGERLPLPALRERLAYTDDRDEREGMFRSYLEALEALNPRFEGRLDGRTLDASPATLGLDPSALAADLQRLMLHTETPYFAALRRYLAQIDIEQGDGTVADLWHIERGGAWTQWFGGREVARATAAAGRHGAGDAGGSWLAAEHVLRADPGSTPGSAAAAAAYATLPGSPEWVEQELGMAPHEVIPFVDFATFVRAWRLREAIGLLHYELRLATDVGPALARTYYSGIVGHTIGVLVPQEMYLVALGDGEPYGSMRDVVVDLLAACLVEELEGRHGATWWREPSAHELIGVVAGASSVDDALAEVGYDALDWRPVLRQIRTRLIGEMSGYGGPNITTRAGTRKL
jgi:hypothetical protein